MGVTMKSGERADPDRQLEVVAEHVVQLERAPRGHAIHHLQLDGRGLISHAQPALTFDLQQKCRLSADDRPKLLVDPAGLVLSAEGRLQDVAKALRKGRDGSFELSTG